MDNAGKHYNKAKSAYTSKGRSYSRNQFKSRDYYSNQVNQLHNSHSANIVNQGNRATANRSAQRANIMTGATANLRGRGGTVTHFNVIA